MSRDFLTEEERLRVLRNTIIEECARVADDMLNHKPTFKYVSDAIRALKDKP